MARYIKQEMPDLRGTGEKKAYYRMEVTEHLGPKEFAELVSMHHPTFGTSVVEAVLSSVAEEMVRQMARGCTVTLGGIGTFGGTIGLVRGKEMDELEGDAPKRNAQSLQVDGVRFRADRELVKRTNRRCRLTRAGVCRLKRSPLSRAERLALALRYLSKHPCMHVREYAELTGLSRSTATVELRELSAAPGSGLTTYGEGRTKVYVKG